MKALCLATCVALAGCDSVGLGGGGLEASFSGPVSESYTYQSLQGGGITSCVVSYDVTGTVHLDLKESVAAGASPGTVEVDWTQTIESRAGNGCGQEGNGGDFDKGGDLTGSLDDFHFTDELKSPGAFVVTARTEVGGQRAGEGATGFVSISRSGSGVTGTTNVSEQSFGTWNLTWK
jgi:hypothetical protein